MTDASRIDSKPCDRPPTRENLAVQEFEHRGLRLVIILPALNEEATIAQVIDRIPRQLDGFDEVLPLVVNDGSTDNTVELSLEAGAAVVSHPENMGVGVAFATGIERALQMGADVIVNMDSDGQFRPEDIPTLVRPIVEKNFGFVTCTRFGDNQNLPKMPAIKLWGNRRMCNLINWITGKQFTDVSCGFRAYSRETALRMNLFGKFTYTQESFIDLASKGIAMCEVPLVVRGEREFGKSRVASNLWRYAIQSSRIIARAMRDTQPLLFFGSAAILLLLIATVSFGFVGIHWLLTGQTSPWTSLLFVGTASSMLGGVTAVLALVADQIGRGRIIQERLLYYSRKQDLAKSSNEPAKFLI
ncbi:MAG: hypothetical protein CBB71_08560 [Rhodopirellula sp. TMED11]|nr:MAG: hypothetical protein CBB71_08560 [Rhodopirellula sp. TMED11]